MDSKTLQALGVVLNQNILDIYKQSKRNEQLEREANMNMHTSALINATKYSLTHRPDNERCAKVYVLGLLDSLHEDSYPDPEEFIVPYWFDRDEVEDDIFTSYFTSRGYCVMKTFTAGWPYGTRYPPDHTGMLLLCYYEVCPLSAVLEGVTFRNDVDKETGKLIDQGDRRHYFHAKDTFC